jgi:NAD(P)-dependent dehydrogenase (short-subunit alcohol dehydrogenase family)
LRARWDRGLFGLVNNAAILEGGPLDEVDEEQVDRHLQTNVVGPLSTVQAFLPSLAVGGGRIVNVGSINAQLPMPMWGLYSASKAALVALSDVLRFELASRGVSVTLLTLGAFATDIRQRSLTTMPAGGPHVAMAERARTLFSALDASAGDPWLVADAIVDVLTAEQAPAHRVVGEGVDDLLALAASPPEVRDAALAQLLETVR